MAETFAIITMICGAIALVLFIDWILRGWLEFADDTINELAYGDCPHVPHEMRLRRRDGERSQATEPVVGNGTQNQTQLNPNASTSLSGKRAGRAVN